MIKCANKQDRCFFSSEKSGIFLQISSIILIAPALSVVTRLIRSMTLSVGGGNDENGDYIISYL